MRFFNFSLSQVMVLTSTISLLTTFSQSAIAANTATTAKRAPVAVAVQTVKKDTLYDWAFSEGIAQGIRREYLNFERGGKVTYIAKDENGIVLRAGSKVKGPKQGEQFGKLLARVDERDETEAVHQAEAQLTAARLQIEQAQTQLQQAKNSENLAADNFARTKAIWEKKLIAKGQFESSRTELLNAQEALKSAQAALAKAKSEEQSVVASLNQAKFGLEKNSIFAPFDGVIRQVNVREGDYWAGPAGASSDKERESLSAMVVIDNSQYEITLNVPYYAANKIKEQQPVFISWSSARLLDSAQTGFKEPQVTSAYVFSVSPSISLGQRAVEVKVHTKDNANLLKDGLHVTAWVMVGKKEQTLVIPQTALIIRNNKPFVYVLDNSPEPENSPEPNNSPELNKGQQAKLVSITTGIEDFDRIEVLSGLRAGMQVITTGNHKLVNGTPIRIVSNSTEPKTVSGE